jgi:hypothetical protein
MSANREVHLPKHTLWVFVILSHSGAIENRNAVKPAR